MVRINSTVVFQPSTHYFYAMDTSILKEAYSAENFREQGHQLIDLLAEHLKATMKEKSGKVIDWQLPEVERKYWEDYEFNGSSNDFFTDLFKRIIHIHHPNYMGHQISPALPLTGLTSLVSAIMNNGMGIYEMGAAPTAMERVSTDYLCKTVGFPNSSRGILTSGGTLANLTALLSARQRFIEHHGNKSQLAVMVSEEAHYCIARAVKIMGMGDEGIVKIPADENFQIRTDLLNQYYNKAKDNGQSIFALVGCAPSTATGIYDDLEGLAQFALQQDIWFHVDGAHGGAAVFSTKYKALLKGMELADSIVIDGHKMMMMPGITTALLYRKGTDSHNTFRQKADYLLEESTDEDWYNLAKRTFECTKHMMSLHWYLTIKEYGPAIFDAFVTRLYDLAKEFADLLHTDPNFELAVEPMSNILCFRYTGTENQRIKADEVNKAIRQKILEKGDFYIVQTKLNGIHYLRTTIMNPFSTSSNFKGLLNHITGIAKSL